MLPHKKVLNPHELMGQPLNDIEHKFAPEALYIQGDTRLMEHPRVSIIGTRNPSTTAIQNTSQLAQFFVKNNIVIVSGLAKGIDTIAHKTAIEHNSYTIAVIGTPLNVYYPNENKNLQQEIAQNHLLISQFPDNTPIQRKNFPLRNRTMALLSHASIIVEATHGSGTIHQGWEALRLGRPLYIIENNDITWAKKLIEYGAEVISIKDIHNILQSLPNSVSVVMKHAPF